MRLPIYTISALLITSVLSTAAFANVSKRYERSLQDAAIIEKDEIVSLKTLTGETTKVVTWTKYPDSYKPGENISLSWGDTWVTLDGDVKSICKRFREKKLDLRVQQLLGLPPEKGVDRFFVVMEAQTGDMFRPCADPSLTSKNCTATFPDGVTEKHKAWYAKQSSISYNAPNGYPWTRLGYTYNWNPKSSEVGPNEFVIKKGSTVKTVSVDKTKTYCQ